MTHYTLLEPQIFFHYFNYMLSDPAWIRFQGSSFELARVRRYLLGKDQRWQFRIEAHEKIKFVGF